MMPVRFGVFVPQGWRMDLTEIDDPIEQYETMTRVARVADEGGWDSIWVFDHFHTVPTPELETCFECWTITATLARDTQNVKIGQMVGCNGYRHPALYAKIASTVDVASHDRLYAGIGAGWYEHERRARSSTACGPRITPSLRASTIRLTGRSTSLKVSKSRISRSGSGAVASDTKSSTGAWHPSL